MIHPDDAYLAECPAANDLEHLEVLPREAQVLDALHHRFDQLDKIGDGFLPPQGRITTLVVQHQQAVEQGFDREEFLRRQAGAVQVVVRGDIVDDERLELPEPSGR